MCSFAVNLFSFPHSRTYELPQSAIPNPQSRSLSPTFTSAFAYTCLSLSRLTEMPVRTILKNENLSFKFIGHVYKKKRLLVNNESRKSVNSLKAGKYNSEIDAIAEHVKKNGNCEFVRIMEQFSKMDVVGKKQFMSYAQKLAE